MSLSTLQTVSLSSDSQQIDLERRKIDRGITGDLPLKRQVWDGLHQQKENIIKQGKQTTEERIIDLLTKNDTPTEVG